MTFRKMLSVVAVAPMILASAAIAVERGDTVGTDGAAIRSALEADGYEVRKIETEDGELEAYALKDGKRYEIHVDPASGKVSRVEEDD